MRFHSQVIKEQLHIIICFSPLGNRLRKCIRNYPSLINCCTIDWLHGWPDDALLAISHRFLAEEEIDDVDRTMAIDMLVEFQLSSMQMAEQYFVQTRNRILLPPVLYIDATNTFKSRLKSKKS